MDYVKRTYERTCEIIGEEGILKWDFKEHTVKMFSAKTKDWETIQDDNEYDINKMYVDEMDCFIGCINGEMTPPVDAVSGKRILEVALAAKESANTRKVMVL